MSGRSSNLKPEKKMVGKDRRVAVNKTLQTGLVKPQSSPNSLLGLVAVSCKSHFGHYNVRGVQEGKKASFGVGGIVVRLSSNLFGDNSGGSFTSFGSRIWGNCVVLQRLDDGHTFVITLFAKTQVKTFNLYTIWSLRSPAKPNIPVRSLIGRSDE